VRSPVLARVAPLLLVLPLATCALQRNIASAPPSGTVGGTAPAVAGTTLDDARLAVAFRGAKTLLVFWASWCGPCRHEQPWLTRMALDLAPQGVQFIGVDFLDHDKASAKAFEEEFKVPYPSLYDDPGKVAAAYEVDAPPEIVLVDSRGIIVGRIPGETSADRVSRLIQAKLL